MLPRALVRCGHRLPNSHEPSSFPSLKGLHLFKSKAEHQLEQADLRIPDGKLSGMHSYGQASGARIAVITREGNLPALVEFPIRLQSKRMRRDHPAFKKYP
jgi:hypothetical protein